MPRQVGLSAGVGVGVQCEPEALAVGSLWLEGVASVSGGAGSGLDPLGAAGWMPLATSRREWPKHPSFWAFWGTAPASPSLFPPGWWARLWRPPGDVARGPPHKPLRALNTHPAAAMARLAAVLWSLCITAVLVTSATQGRCCWGGGGDASLKHSQEGG